MSQHNTHAEEARALGALERKHAGPKAFRAMSAPVWRNGQLSEKDKHLVAVAIGQVTRCGFCIEHHAELAHKLGASESEAFAVSYLTSALESLGGAVLALGQHGFVLENEPHLTGTSIASSRAAFVQAVFDTDVLPRAFVWTVAAAIAYAQSHETHRQLFHAQALAAGSPVEALNEAYSIVAVLRAGAVYAHTLHVAAAFANA